MSRIAATPAVWPHRWPDRLCRPALRHTRDTTAVVPGRHGGTVVGMITQRILGLGAAGLLLLSACSGPASTTTHSSLGKVLFVGDSVAVGEALPMTAAFQASHVDFRSIAADGGGNVVGPFADQQWPALSAQLTSAKAAVVVYQITTYDWGTEQQQKAAYDKLLGTVTGTGAELVFVTMPPIRPDDFYRPHMADLDRTTDVARSVVAGSAGKATVLDSAAVWGGTYQQTRDGRPDRSADGIHTCPQGAARFTGWLLGEFGKLFPGFTPAPAQDWANTGWSADRHFQGC